MENPILRVEINLCLLQTLNSKSVNVEIMIGNNTNEIINMLFESFLLKYQIGLKETMKYSYFVFDCIDLSYNSHKLSLHCTGSYTDSPTWTSNKSNNKCNCQEGGHISKLLFGI